jgi:Lrp/AsnC family leucine-responsive transcriptional regulator
MQLDDIDKRILRALQRDGRLQNVELAKEVGLSPSPCLRRVRLLEEAGVIDRYVAVLNPTKIHLGLSLFARVWLTAQNAETIDRFIAAIEQLPQVVECYIMLGDCDFLLRVVAADLEDYRKFQIAHLSRIPGVQNLKTEVPSQTVKQTYALPLR